MTIEAFPAWVKSGEWDKVKDQLLSGRYDPQPVRRVEIDKPDGGKRLLGIPTVIDPVLQQAIAQVLTPIFDPTFSPNSFGFRPGRNGHQAVKQVQQIINPTVADALLDRLIHNSHRIALEGESMRKLAESDHLE